MSLVRASPPLVSLGPLVKLFAVVVGILAALRHLRKRQGVHQVRRLHQFGERSSPIDLLAKSHRKRGDLRQLPEPAALSSAALHLNQPRQERLRVLLRDPVAQKDGLAPPQLKCLHFRPVLGRVGQLRMPVGRRRGLLLDLAVKSPQAIELVVVAIELLVIGPAQAVEAANAPARQAGPVDGARHLAQRPSGKRADDPILLRAVAQEREDQIALILARPLCDLHGRHTLLLEVEVHPRDEEHVPGARLDR